jgi:hypothetical protein
LFLSRSTQQQSAINWTMDVSKSTSVGTMGVTTSVSEEKDEKDSKQD